MFDYLEELDMGCGAESELDPIACCCEFSEYDNIEAFQADYSDEYETMDDIRNETIVLDVGEEGFIIVCF